ncbi:MAG: hypothetical protein L6R36_000295 [Xanthoria steineri]|nr:MAG: hypothetical protein L6R36_000295 [Xanthoria steineri]
MSIATLAYRSPLIGDSPEAIACGIDNASKDRGASKNVMASSARRWLDSQQQDITSPCDEPSSFFDFEPQIGSASPFAPQYPALPGTDLTPGWNAIVPQVPSPPHSAASPPPSWPPFPSQQQPMHNILTDIYSDTRVQYGQNTPPDDAFPNTFAIPEKNEESGRKQKRSSTTNDVNSNSPAKRSRKNGRSSNSSNRQASSSVEDERRSKFLERNRVAASKCRQKKKEWTQNLESRARELQKENHSLRMMLDSMREEMMFIKDEMLKHTTCGCKQIQSWVHSNAESLCTNPTVKTEHSPIDSAPASRAGSVDTSGGEFPHQDSTSPAAKAVQPSALPQTQNLEALLIDQLTHNTSDQGIAKTLGVAA